ncbi:MAG: hypothetical protein ABJF10_29040 [Chthoniobacter sp.]|uniref:hypothetical protein n=1 Tax=Chthoniobacter sp. TaxID=2510640 RepID=UPI0032A34FC3
MLSKKRVCVLEEPYSFIVVVDSEPVLRCAARRDALRYAVMVRRALIRAEVIEGGAASLKPSPRARKKPN